MNKFRLFIISSIIIMSGCSVKKEYVPQIVVKEVKVPVKQDIPDYDCSFNASTDPEVIDNLIKCIKDLKQILDTLKGVNDEK